MIKDWISNLQLSKWNLTPPLQRIKWLRSNAQERANPDAVFLGWQKTPSKEFFALYNVMAVHHPFCHSTVTEDTLRELRLQVPSAPHPPGPLMRIDYGTRK